jgi:3-hydroxyisobutyrate dehydrogenase-like beta-hydroxyacid dehydrogenase
VTSVSPRVAYIGLGSMGGAMASHLLKQGRELVVHDLSAEVVARMVDKGAIEAPDAEAATRDVDIVSICVPAAHHVDAVLDAMGASLRPGLTILVHSTIGPSEVRALADKAAASGAVLRDACIAGGGSAAARGEVVMFVGGLDDLSVPVRELLDQYARVVLDGGTVGGGAALKVAINVMTYAQFAAASIGHDVVTSEGVDVGVLIEAWKQMGMFGVTVEQFSMILGLPAEHLGGMLDMLRVQADNAYKDLSLAVETVDVSPVEEEWVAALRAAIPTFYRYEQAKELHQ